MSLDRNRAIRKEVDEKGKWFLIFLCLDCKKEIRVWNSQEYLNRHQGRCKPCATRKRNLEKSLCPHRPNRKERDDGTCAECRKEQMSKFQKKQSIGYRIYHSAKSRAKKLGIPWGISKEYCDLIWPKDNKCPILGIELQSKNRRGPSKSSPSLDRIIPDLGYVEGNVSIISFLANSIKQDQTDPAIFRKMADWLEKIVKPQ